MIARTSTIWFPMIVLAVLALITLWIDHTVKLDTPKIDGSNRHDVDYFLENFVTTRTDANGNLRHVLAAVEMRHYPDNDSTELVRPRYTQYGENKPATQIQGQKGYVSSNGEVVEFKGNVVITREASKDRGETKITTDYIKIFPKEEKVMTNSQVVITQPPNTKIIGQGMTYDKLSEDFKLNSGADTRVKVYYDGRNSPTPTSVKNPEKSKVRKKR